MEFKKLTKDEDRENRIEIAVEKYIEQLQDNRPNLTDYIYNWIDLNIKTTLSEEEVKLQHKKDELQYKLEQELTDEQIVKLRVIDYLTFRLGEEKLIIACSKILKRE